MKSTEAQSSVSYTLQHEGFSFIFTVRRDDEAELLEVMEDLESIFTERGYNDSRGTPKATAKAAATADSCPTCGEPLVTFTTKTGKSGIQCSTRKYDYMTKTTTGCDYIKWDDAPASDVPATFAQKGVLMGKGLWEDGMTKTEAGKLISEALKK